MTAVASGWWYGHYWVLVCVNQIDRMLWYTGELEAWADGVR